jgi:hypothetical protein
MVTTEGLAVVYNCPISRFAGAEWKPSGDTKSHSKITIKQQKNASVSLSNLRNCIMIKPIDII